MQTPVMPVHVYCMAILLQHDLQLWRLPSGQLADQQPSEPGCNSATLRCVANACCSHDGAALRQLTRGRARLRWESGAAR